MSRQTRCQHVPLERWLVQVASTACTLLGYDFCAVFLPDQDGSGRR